MSCLCGNQSLLNPKHSGVCLHNNETHWVCAACAPGSMCVKHKRRCVQTHDLWAKTALKKPYTRNCAFGCLQPCTVETCRRTKYNFEIVLHSGHVFKSHAAFRQCISSRSNIICTTAPDFPSSLFVVQANAVFGTFKALSLFVTGQHATIQTFGISLILQAKPPFYGDSSAATFRLQSTVPANNVEYTNSNLGFDSVECNGSPEVVQCLKLVWPNCILSVESVACKKMFV